MAENEHPEPETQGGSGGLAQPASRSNLQLMQRALRNDWPVPPELRGEAIRELREIINKSKSKRAKVSAIKALALMDGLNIKREQMDQKADYWQFRADAPPGDTTVNVGTINITPDDKRTGLAAIRERLGLGAGTVLEGHAEANGSVDPHANGSSPEKHNGNGKPRGDADAPDQPPS